jgi:hypothetical protein
VRKAKTLRGRSSGLLTPIAHNLRSHYQASGMSISIKKPVSIIICQFHAGQIEEGLHLRGLGQFIQPPGSFSIKGAGTGTDGPFDPKAMAALMLNAAANDVIGEGVALRTRKTDDGADYCPLCEADGTELGLSADWLAGCLNAILRHAQKRGFVRLDTRLH